MKHLRELIKKPETVLYLGAVLLFVLIVCRANVMEDAYITFRTVDQFTHGNGLRWNIHERVQSYTNPLWMLLHIPFYYLWENIYFITLFLSFACAAVAIILPLRTHKAHPILLLYAFLVPLMASDSFVKFSTSGLENPLTHMLFAWFGYLLLRCHSDRRWFWLSLATSLSLVNRLDLVIFYFPIWVTIFALDYRVIRWKHLFLGALPIVGWEIFSLFYYGFLFPNTKYAKLNTGIALLEYLNKGKWYALNLAVADLPSFIWIFLSFVIVFYFRKSIKTKKENLYFLSIALAVCVYTGYFIVVGGGNHVTGRTLSLPIFASVWGFPVIAHQLWEKESWKRVLRVGIIALLCFQALYPSKKIQKRLCPPCFAGIFPQFDESVFRTRLTPEYLLDYIKGKPILLAATLPEKQVIIDFYIGKLGFKSSRNTIIIDRLALTDPLLSRLPSKHKKLFAAGHSTRDVPKGYIHAINTGDTSEMNPSLAQYYEKLRLITQGDLWSSERLVTILYFNLGAYDYLKTLKDSDNLAPDEDEDLPQDDDETLTQEDEL